MAIDDMVIGGAGWTERKRVSMQARPSNVHKDAIQLDLPPDQLLVFSATTSLACSFLARMKVLNQEKISDNRTSSVVTIALPLVTYPSPPHFWYSLP